MGTLKRVPATTYSLLPVMKGELWLPALFGISMMLARTEGAQVDQAMRGVLLPLMKHHLPSGTPSVMRQFRHGGCRPKGMNPWLVVSMPLVSSL
jgi:hypothetical protein